MYQIINQTLKDYLTVNKDFIEPINAEKIEIAIDYTELWSKNENAIEELRLDFSNLHLPELARYLDVIEMLNIKLYRGSELQSIINDLGYIDEALAYEEENCLGLSKTAHYHRKRWRKLIRMAKKHFKSIIKHHLTYEKEWSKPRQVYILNITGECHNGLYWTFREMLLHPSYIKCGFHKFIVR